MLAVVKDDLRVKGGELDYQQGWRMTAPSRKGERLGRDKYDHKLE